MLLRRFAKHLKEQHWTAICIEFAIVVVGVFLGLQVQNWNQARAEREAAVIYHARLIEEIRRNEHNLVARRDYYREVRRHAELALAKLRESRQSKAELDGNFLVDTYHASQRWLLSVDRGVYDELIHSGVMNTVLDPDSRTRLTNYYVIFAGILTSVTDDTTYRNLIRTHLPIDMQRDIEDCSGDTVVVDETDAVSISFGGTIPDWPPAKIAVAVESLLAIPDFRSSLNFRISDLDTKLKVLQRRIDRSRALAIYFEEVGPKG